MRLKLLAIILLLLPSISTADQLDFFTTTGTQASTGYLVQQLPEGTSGSISYIKFKNTNPSEWSLDTQGRSTAFITLTQCDSLSTNTDIIALESNGCNGRVRNSLLSTYTTTINGEDLTINFNQTIQLDPTKRYIFAFYNGASGAGRVGEHRGTTENKGNNFPCSSCANYGDPGVVELYWRSDAIDPRGGGFDSQETYQTRFLNFELTTSSPTQHLLDVSYFLELSEINPQLTSRNPTLIKFRWIELNNQNNLSPNSQAVSITQTQGQSTTTIPFSAAPGLYSGLVTFSNFGETVDPSVNVFGRSQLYFDFEVDVNGEVVNIVNVQNLNGTEPFGGAGNQFEDCSIADIGTCVVSLVRYLFVPSEASVGSALSLVSSSSIPFVQEGYQYYETTRSALEESQNGFHSSTSTLGVRIETEKIEPFQLISIASITQNLGDAGPILRSIALTVLIISFFAMIVRSIQDKLSVSIRSYDQKI